MKWRKIKGFHRIACPVCGAILETKTDASKAEVEEEGILFTSSPVRCSGKCGVEGGHLDTDKKGDLVFIPNVSLGVTKPVGPVQISLF